MRVMIQFQPLDRLPDYCRCASVLGGLRRPLSACTPQPVMSPCRLLLLALTLLSAALPAAAGVLAGHLTGLTLSDGTLNPPFHSPTFFYTATVGNEVTSITVTPTTSDSPFAPLRTEPRFATPNAALLNITVNGQPVPSGAPSNPISLDVGPNTIEIRVTDSPAFISSSITRAGAPKPTASPLRADIDEVYTVTVFRDSAPPPLDTTPPTLIPVSLTSNNADPTLAVAGDTVTVTFTADEPIQTPNVILAGDPATVTDLGGNQWAATLVVTPDHPQGTVDFSISAIDLSGNPTSATFTTDMTSVVIDSTAPVAVADSLNRPNTTQVAKVLLSDLVGNDTSYPPYSALTITAVGNAVQTGPGTAMVAISGGFAVYTASAANSGNGSFEYTVSDGAGGHEVTGTVTVTQTLPTPGTGTPNAVTIVPSGSDFLITFIGVPGNVYHVQYTTDAAPPRSWIDFAGPDHTAAANGVFIHTDVAPVGDQRFYRAVTGPTPP